MHRGCSRTLLERPVGKAGARPGVQESRVRPSWRHRTIPGFSHGRRGLERSFSASRLSRTSFHASFTPIRTIFRLSRPYIARESIFRYQLSGASWRRRGSEKVLSLEIAPQMPKWVVLLRTDLYLIVSYSRFGTATPSYRPADDCGTALGVRSYSSRYQSSKWWYRSGISPRSGTILPPL